MYLRPQGYAVIIDPAEGIKECDTFTCAHCHRIVHVKPATDPAANGGRCLTCEDGMSRGLICSECVGQPCTPFFKRLDAEEKRETKRITAMVL